MMILAYDKDGIIMTDRVPNGITITAAYYQKFIHWLHMGNTSPSTL